MRVNLVVAVSANNVIGVNGELPWHLPDDLRYFKQLTMGKPIVMGRRTWNSIGRPLPGRQNIVVTRQTGYAADGATVAASPEEAMRVVGNVNDVMVIGGGQIFEAFWPLAARIYLTRVAVTLEGDAFFPTMVESEWVLTSSESRSADERHAYDFEFKVYDRL